MSPSWFEIWGDTGLSPPYLLIVVASEGTNSNYDVIDPQDGGKCVFKSHEYDGIRSWLSEDEYVRLSDRVSED
jgi:hypothetical protein